MTEAAFTEPHADCPHPERWSAADSEATEHEVTELVAAMVTALQPDVVVETGTYTAQTAVAIADALHGNGAGHVWTFETNADRAGEAQQRLVRHRERATAIHGRLQDWAPPAPVDFAWIDSGDAEVREAEIRWLLPRCGRLAVIGVHDTRYDSVKGMLRRLCEARLITFPLFLPTPRGAAFFRLPK